MTLAAFLSRLRDLDVRLWLEGDRLRFSAPEKVVTPELRAELSARKADIIAFLYRAEAAVTSTAPPIRPISRDADVELPLSFAQQRMVFLDQLVPDNPFYNIPTARRLRGRLDVAALKRTFNKIAHRHEVLRTTFAIKAGRPIQVIASTLSTELPVLDLRELVREKKEAVARHLAIQEAQRPFDLSQGPLLRVMLLQLDKKEFVLLLNMHHVVSDGWSTGVLFREISALYEAFSNGRPSPLPELPVQYVDFAAWQRKWLQGEVLERQLTYWRQKLDGAPAVLELPADRPRPPMPTYRGATHSLSLSKSLTEALKQLSQREGVTLFMTLLATFKALLHRYTGQQDIVVGSLIANRNRSETEGLIGFFANTLVLRTDLAGNPTLRELLNRVRRTALEAYAHQDLPFEVLVEELQPQRDTSRNPLIQIIFNLQDASEEALRLPEIALEWLKFEGGTARLDIELHLQETEHGLAGILVYSTDLFDATTITSLVEHFRILLKGIVAASKDAQRRLADLSILTDVERQRLLVEWNDTACRYPKDKCIHELFEAQVARTPDAVAMTFSPANSKLGLAPNFVMQHRKDKHITYQELNHRANQLAHYLQELDVGPEALVGVYVERAPEMIVGLLGVLKAGGAYVPLDPTYPQQRLAFMLENSQATVLLTQSQLASKLPNQLTRPTGESTIIRLDADWEKIRRMPSEAPARVVTADNIAYTIYTSGSTGKPKGVQISHGAAINFLDSMRTRPGLSEQDILLSVTTLSFDIAVLELFLPLTVGARVDLAALAVTVDGIQLREQLVTSRATVMQATPATWWMLLATGWQGGQGLKILSGGEALPRALANKLLKRDATLWNMYGPTETTVWSLIHAVKKETGQVSIGRPIGNTQIYLLDAHLQPVPVGVAGELYIGGDGLARGYLDSPRLTATSFIPHPFSHKLGERLYRTGDLARYLRNGTVEFLGRIDHQVKVRGFRIELEEIEAVLREHPRVQEAVVVAQVREDAPEDKRLVAYLVTAGGVSDLRSSSSVNELRRHLRLKLPDYMVPSHFVTLEALPLTPSGKIDRRALPAPDSARPELEEAFVAPRTPVEKTLAEIWAEILQLERIGAHDNFFELGGHSLLGIRLTSRLRDVFQIELPLIYLFETPTVAGLSKSIETVCWAARDMETRPVIRGNDREEGEL